MIDKENDTVFTLFRNEKKPYKLGIYRKSKIVIPAAYQDIISYGDHYFYLYKSLEDAGQLMKINPKDNSHIVLPYELYGGTLSNGLQVFKKKGGLFGLVKNDTEIIFPFEYESIDQFGSFIFCEKSDYKGMEIFDENLNKVQDMGIVKIETLSCIHNLLVAYKSNEDNEYDSDEIVGIMDYNLKWIAKYFNGVKNINDTDGHFVIIKRSENKRNLLYGIINKDGKEIIPPKYDFIEYQFNNDNLLKFREKQGDETRLISLKELLDKNKK